MPDVLVCVSTQVHIEAKCDMNTSRLSICLTIVIVTGTLAGCAGQGKPATVGDVMRGHATEAQDTADVRNEIAANWEQGQKLTESGEKKVNDGEKKVAKAEDELRKAKQQVAEGQREIAEGTALVQASERRFNEAFPGLELRNAD
jgi:tyrosyl-tRNA synthetase